MVYNSSVNALQLDYLFEALSNTRRRNLIKLLSHEKSMSIADFAKAEEVSIRVASKHVALLKRAKLVFVTKSGRENQLKLNKKELARAEEWIARFSHTLHERFELIQIYLEESES